MVGEKQSLCEDWAMALKLRRGIFKSIRAVRLQVNVLLLSVLRPANSLVDFSSAARPQK